MQLTLYAIFRFGSSRHSGTPTWYYLTALPWQLLDSTHLRRLHWRRYCCCCCCMRRWWCWWRRCSETLANLRSAWLAQRRCLIQSHDGTAQRRQGEQSRADTRDSCRIARSAALDDKLLSTAHYPPRVRPRISRSLSEIYVGRDTVTDSGALYNKIPFSANAGVGTTHRAKMTMMNNVSDAPIVSAPSSLRHIAVSRRVRHESTLLIVGRRWRHHAATSGFLRRCAPAKQRRRWLLFQRRHIRPAGRRTRRRLTDRPQ